MVIQFHHLEPEEKLFHISRSWTRYGKQKILEELAKCVCLCANCHLRVHHGKAEIPEEHRV